MESSLEFRGETDAGFDGKKGCSGSESMKEELSVSGDEREILHRIVTSSDLRG